MKEKNCRSKQAAGRVIRKLTGLYPEHETRAKGVGWERVERLDLADYKKKVRGVVREVSRMLGGDTVGKIGMEPVGFSWDGKSKPTFQP